MRGMSDGFQLEGHHSTIPLNLNKNSKYLLVAGYDDQGYDMIRHVSMLHVENILLYF